MGIFSRKSMTRTYYASSMTNMEIIEEDLLQEAKVRLALKFMQNAGYDARDYALDYGNTGAAQFFQYHMIGKNEFIDGLPVVTVGGGGIPISSAQEALNNYFGKNVVIVDFEVVEETFSKLTSSGGRNYSGTGYPDTAKAIACQYYDYDYASNTLYYNNKIYYLDTYHGFFHYDEYTKISSGYLQSLLFREYGTNVMLNLQPITYLPISNYIPSTPVEESAYYVQPSYNAGEGSGGWYYRQYADIITLGPYARVVYVNPNTGRTQIIMHPVNPTMTYWGTRLEELTLDETAVSLATVAKERTIDKYEAYPIATIRQNGIDIISWANLTGEPLERYKSTKALLEGIGMPLDTLTEAYSDPDSFSSGSLSDLKDVHFVVGVSPGNTDSPIISKVLYQHFNKIYNDFPPFKPVKGSDAYSTYVVETRERRFTNYLTWTPVDTVIETDSKPLGTYSHSIKTEPLQWSPSPGNFIGPYQLVPSLTNYTVAYDDEGILYPTDFTFQLFINGAWHLIDNMADSIKIGDTTYYLTDNIYRGKAKLISLARTQVTNFGGEVGTRYSVSFSNTEIFGVNDTSQLSHSLILKYQFSETQARIITLYNFNSITNAIERQIINDLINDDGSLNKNLIVLFHESEVSNLSFMERTDLLSHSLHLNFFAQSSKTVTIKYGGFLNVFVKVIAVVITVIVCIVAPPAGAGMAASFGTAAAAAATAAALSAFTNLLMGLVISVVLKIVMSQLNIGGWLGAVINFVVSIVVTYVTGGFSGFTDNLAASSLKMASQLTELASNIMQAISLEGMQEVSAGFQKLQEEIGSFFSQYTTSNEKYNDIMKSLNTGIGPEFLVSLQRMGGYGSGTGTTGSEYANGWVLSPTAIYETSMTAQYAYDTLYSNDIETYCNRSLTIGIV